MTFTDLNPLSLYCGSELTQLIKYFTSIPGLGYMPFSTSIYKNIEFTKWGSNVTLELN